MCTLVLLHLFFVCARSGTEAKPSAMKLNYRNILLIGNRNTYNDLSELYITILISYER